MAGKQADLEYILSRIGTALILAGNYLLDQGSVSLDEPTDAFVKDFVSASRGDLAHRADLEGADEGALGEVQVTVARAPLRSDPTKSISPDLGRLLKGEQVPLDAISEDGQWYRVDVRLFAGVHTIPEDAGYAWAEADRFEILGVAEDDS